MRSNYSCLRSKEEKSVLRTVPAYGDTVGKSVKKSRLCLRCGEKFISIGSHNRLCGNCVSVNNKIAAKEFYVGQIYLHELT